MPPPTARWPMRAGGNARTSSANEAMWSAAGSPSRAPSLPSCRPVRPVRGPLWLRTRGKRPAHPPAPP
eukprot:10128691-Alexandrium_andersonii.AAC.1